jgi:hypothetical protein
LLEITSAIALILPLPTGSGQSRRLVVNNCNALVGGMALLKVTDSPQDLEMWDSARKTPQVTGMTKAACIFNLGYTYTFGIMRKYKLSLGFSLLAGVCALAAL